MNISVWRQKFHISLLSVSTGIGFVVVFGVFWGYALLLKDKELTTQKRALHYLQENRQLAERNRELEQRIAAMQDKYIGTQEHTAETPNSDSQREQANQRSFVYTVKKGDTVWDIAALYNVDVESLMRWNNMTPRSKIFPGDQLTIIRDE